MTPHMTHRDATAAMRAALKVAGIAARVRMFKACQIAYVQVFSVEHGRQFSGADIGRIATIADRMGMTGAQRAKIDPAHESRLTGKEMFAFEFWGA